LRSHLDEYGNKHPRVGSALHNIAIVQLRDGSLDDALDAIEEAVRVRKAAFGNDHPKVADSLVEKGIILLSRKEFHDSIETFNDALEICENKFGKNDIRVCKILNNIGCIYFEFGDLDASEKVFLEATDMQRELKDQRGNKDKPGALTSMSTLCNIGYVYIDGSKYDKAIGVLEEAMLIQIDVLDRGNKLILNTLDNLGYAYSMDGDYDKAVCQYDELLEFQIEGLGRHHIEVSETLMKLIWVHIKLYEWEEARTKLERVQKIQAMHLDRRDRKLIKTDNLLCQVNYQLLKYTSPSEAIAVSLTSAGVRNPITGKKIDFSFLSPPTEDMKASVGSLKKPYNSSKMSGHKLNYS
jgi:tetratricopeptide (TPR) repeat protein